MKMNLEQLKHLLDHPSVNLKWFDVNGEAFSVMSYSISTPDLWKLPHAVEARGITFNKNGECVCRPFEKFWNLGEREETQLDALLDKFDGQEVYIQEKIDGSLICPVLANGRVFMKSKKSFYSDVAIAATKFVQERSELEALLRFYCEAGETLIFEYTSPNNQIVIPHTFESLTLLAIRDNTSGNYSDQAIVKNTAATLGCYEPKLRISPQTLDRKTTRLMVDGYKAEENTEGVVIVFDNNTRVKVKTEWYLARHRICTMLRVRDIADLVAEEKLDDFMDEIRNAGLDLEKVDEIASQVAQEFSKIQKQAEDGYHASEYMDDKNAWAHVQQKHGGKIAGIVMRMRRGQEPESRIHALWKELYRNDYPLVTLTGF